VHAAQKLAAWALEIDELRDEIAALEKKCGESEVCRATPAHVCSYAGIHVCLCACRVVAREVVPASHAKLCRC
jgi:hypothetical protein